jgi:hypothetical protein
MKKTILLISTIIAFISLNAQISDVNRNSSGYCKVYNAGNKLISQGYIGSASDDFFYSSCIIITRNRSGYVKVYDENLKLISQGYCGGIEDIFNVVGCNIIIKNKSNYKKTYNKFLKLISQGY